MYAYALMLLVTLLAFVQLPQPSISKDAISVHQVHRGTMPLREIASGTITSTAPPQATVTLPLKSRDALQLGQAASIQIKPPMVIHGKVARIEKDSSSETITAEIELTE